MFLFIKMFKIIRLSPPTKLQHQCATSFAYMKNTEIKNRNVRRKNPLTVVKRGHMVFPSNIQSIKRLQNQFISTFPLNDALHRYRPSNHYVINFVPQNRSFSFQSTVESLAQTQSAIFSSLSKSTPVEYCQTFLLSVHDFTGLPWWASIVCSTIILRTCVTVPLAVYQQYILAKLDNLKHELPELVKLLKQETALAVRMYGWDEKMARATYNRSLRKQWNNLIIRDNCHPFKSTILLWFQIPMWISVSVSLRNLVYMLPNQDLNAQLTFAELTVGGFGFIPNLTMVDESWIFPVILGIVNLLIVELQILAKAPTATSSNLQKYLTNGFRVLSVLMIPIAASVPSCLTLYWTTSSTYGLLQNIILMSPKVKRLCGIPKNVNEEQHPYQMIISNIKKRLKIS